jgi:superfamily II DNA/RNA helicase
MTIPEMTDIPGPAATDVTPETATKPEAQTAEAASPAPETARVAEEEPDRISEPLDDPAIPDEEEAPIPPPLEEKITFFDLGLGHEILKAIEEAGYVHPTPIQAQAIPVVLMGRDVLASAQTGTGKTASFTLPMIEILSSGRAKARMPRSLILEPTRELAAQVAENFDTYGKYHKLSKALLIGGESMDEQKRILDRGVDVLIATPGRLLDLFDRGRILLNDVKVLVIDEADRMLDMGFIPDVERIVSLLPSIRQTLFFSATMPPEVKRLADAFLFSPKRIEVAPPATPASTVAQLLVMVDELDKREALRRLIQQEEVKNAFIFCNRKKTVSILNRSLQRHNLDADELHGDMAQSARVATLEKFRSDKIRLLVCSDVAARGLDIQGVSHVFNFDVPFHAEDYVHRIGRTGRAGKQGRAFTIATPEDGKFLSAIEKMLGREIPRLSMDGLTQAETKGAEGETPERGEKGRGRGRGRGGRSEERPRRGRAKKEDSPRGEAAEQVAESAGADAPPIQPEQVSEMVRETARHEAQQDTRPEPRSENDRGGRSRERGERDRGRERKSRDHGRPREREERDEKVIGFGDDIPAFMLRAVKLPPPPSAIPGLDEEIVEDEDVFEAEDEAMGETEIETEIEIVPPPLDEASKTDGT